MLGSTEWYRLVRWVSVGVQSICRKQDFIAVKYTRACMSGVPEFEAIEQIRSVMPFRVVVKQQEYRYWQSCDHALAHPCSGWKHEFLN